MDRELAHTVDFIKNYCRQPKPVLGLVLGSGLGPYADTFIERTALPFNKIPHFNSPSISGHAGTLVFGSVVGVPCVALQGRLHYYEGYSMREVAFPIRVLGYLGISRLVVTNAAGGVNPAFEPGDLMLIEDHINLMGSNPLIGYNPKDFERRFPDMTEAYDGPMRESALEIARRKEIVLHRGVYAAVPGPVYETPAEVRMYRLLGADAVGMSTVPEVIAAVQMGIRILGISCITNRAAGIGAGKITHSEVLQTTDRSVAKFRSLLDGIITAVCSLQ